MEKSTLKIDTIDVCLLCQKKNCPDLTSDTCGKSNSTSSAIKMLLRYLNVDITELVPSVSFCESQSKLNNVNLEMNLCSECSSVAHVFLGLFQAFECIRLQLDKCVRDLLELIEKGRDKQHEKVKAGESSNPPPNKISDAFREKTIKKATRNVETSAPRVSLQKLDTFFEKNDFVNADTESNNQNDTSTTDNIQMEVEVGGSNYRVKCFHCHQYFQNREKLQKHQREKHSKSQAPDNVSNDSCPLPDPLAIQAGSVKGKSSVNFGWNIEEIGSSSSLVSPEADNPDHFHDEGCLEGMDASDDNRSEEGINKQVEVAPEGVVSDPEIESTDIIPPFYSEAEECSLTTLVTLGTSIPSLPPFVCNYCEKEFPKRTTLERHYLSQHASSFLSDDGRLPPSISENELNTALEYLVNQGDPEVIKCPICEKTGGFQWKYQVKPHLLQRHLHNVILCLGYKLAPPPEEPAPDSQSEANKPWKCGCGKHFTKTKSPLPIKKVDNVKTKPSNRRKPSFPCEHCGRTFSIRCNLQSHLIANHPARYFSTQIPVGVSEQDVQVAVNRLVRKCRKILKPQQGQGGKPNVRNYWFECPVCGRRLYQLCEMRLHIPRVHFDSVIETTVKGGNFIMNRKDNFKDTKDTSKIKCEVDDGYDHDDELMGEDDQFESDNCPDIKNVDFGDLERD